MDKSTKIIRTAANARMTEGEHRVKLLTVGGATVAYSGILGDLCRKAILENHDVVAAALGSEAGLVAVGGVGVMMTLRWARRLATEEFVSEHPARLNDLARKEKPKFGIRFM